MTIRGYWNHPKDTAIAVLLFVLLVLSYLFT